MQENIIKEYLDIKAQMTKLKHRETKLKEQIMSEMDWMERAQHAEALVSGSRAGTETVKEKLRQMTDLFGIRGSFEGGLKIDYTKLVANLGIEQCLELRKIIDEAHNISGEPGDKPRVRLHA